jgi:hypothetical protein
VRTSARLAALTLVVGAAAACGVDSPTDATVEEFCETYQSVFTDAVVLGEDPSAGESVAFMKAWGDRLQEVGTPEDIPDQAREGFEVTVEALQDLDDDASMDDIANLEQGLDEEAQAAGQAFAEYVGQTCETPAPAGSESESESESEPE